MFCRVYTICGWHLRLLSSTCWYALNRIKAVGQQSWPPLLWAVKKAWNIYPHFYMRLHGMIINYRDAISYQRTLWKLTTIELLFSYYRRRIATAPTDGSLSQRKLIRDVRDYSCVLPCNVACYSATDTARSSARSDKSLGFLIPCYSGNLPRTTTLLYETASRQAKSWIDWR